MQERPGIELDERHADSRAAWIIQRAGWVFMFLLIVAAALGAFGTGPVDDARVWSDEFELSYSRFPRASSTGTLELLLPTAQGDLTRLWISQSYVRHFEIRTINPQPESSTSSADKVFFAFRSLPGKPLVVRFHLHPGKDLFGRLSGRVGLEGGGEVEFSQFMWP